MINNITYTAANIYQYELTKNKYDLVFASEFHPFTRSYYSNNKEKEAHHEKIMMKIHSSLKKDGHLIISHSPKDKQSINIKKHIKNKFKVKIYDVDEPTAQALDFILKLPYGKEMFFFALRFLTILKKSALKLGIVKGYKPICILQKT